MEIYKEKQTPKRSIKRSLIVFIGNVLGIYLISKSKGILFVYLPNFLNILVIMFSISAQDVRFLYSNFLVFYLLVMILISELEKHKFLK